MVLMICGVFVDENIIIEENTHKGNVKFSIKEENSNRPGKIFFPKNNF
jgi:hypothetical protein